MANQLLKYGIEVNKDDFLGNKRESSLKAKNNEAP